MLTPTAARCCALLFCAAPLLVFGATTETPLPSITPAVNALGLDLYREQIKSANGTNVLLSPYSLSSALAMTYTGADGVTRDEMQKALHLPADPADCGAAFHSLAAQLAEVVGASEAIVANQQKYGGDATPIQLNVANRIFVQSGYELRPTFIEQLRQNFGANPARLDFRRNPVQARQTINRWVAEQTYDRIRDLLPENQPTPYTQLALVNALYLRAAWQHEFKTSATRHEPFQFIVAKAVPVPMLRDQSWYGYSKRDGYTVVTLPYITGKLQFVLLVPDATDGLAALEKSLTEPALTACARLDSREVNLHLPKFKLAPATLPLSQALQTLGLRTAFDLPKGSANFDRMAPRKKDGYLYIEEVFHKTWLALDEHGTEAAAATAMAAGFAAGIPREQPRPVEVRADRPFMFALQHVPSGACLFLGRVTDPR
ncbi:MAG: serpin family protein [Opitutaceae bacterium]|jgi:serpin B